MEKRITIFFVMTMLLVSVSPLGAFAQTNQSDTIDAITSQSSVSSPSNITPSPGTPGTVPPPPGTSGPPPCIPREEAPKALTKEEYVKRALRNICLNPDTFYRDYGRYSADDWRWINRYITARYAELYIGHPEVFKWAGMAAYASSLVGWGMGRSAYAASGFNSELFSALRDGNIQLYLNIAWQHEAYLSEGICAIERIHREGKLADNQRDADALLSAWRSIDTGMKEGNPEQVRQGNAALLQYEQTVFLERVVYKPHRKLWQDVTNSWVMPIFSPIPGDSVTFVNYINKAYPGITPDLGDINQRWDWISKSMLPKYNELEKGTHTVELHTTKYVNELHCKQPAQAVPRSPIPRYCPCSENTIAPESTPSGPIPFPTLPPSEPSAAAPVPFPTPPSPSAPTEAPPREEEVIIDTTDPAPREEEEEVTIDTTDPAENPPEGPSEQSSAE